jgi:hypothetical protein
MQDKAIRLILDIKSQLPEASNKEIARVIAPDLGINDDEGIESLATEIDGIDVEANKKKELSDPNQVQTEEPTGLASSALGSDFLSPKPRIKPLTERASLLNPDIEATNKLIGDKIHGIISSADSKEGAASAITQLEQQFRFNLGEDERQNILDLTKQSVERRAEARGARVSSAAFAQNERELNALLEESPENEKEAVRDAYARAQDIRAKYPEFNDQINAMVDQDLVTSKWAARAIARNTEVQRAIEDVGAVVNARVNEKKFDEAIVAVQALNDVRGIGRKEKEKLAAAMVSGISTMESEASISDSFGRLRVDDAQAIVDTYIIRTGQEMSVEEVLGKAEEFKATIPTIISDALMAAANRTSLSVPSEEYEEDLVERMREANAEYESMDRSNELSQQILKVAFAPVVGPISFPYEEAKLRLEKAKAELAAFRVNKERMIEFSNDADNEMAVSTANIYEMLLPLQLAQSSANPSAVMRSSNPIRTAFELSDAYTAVASESEATQAKAMEDWAQEFVNKNQEEIRNSVVSALQSRFGTVDKNKLEDTETRLKSIGVEIDLTGDGALGANIGLIRTLSGNMALNGAMIVNISAVDEFLSSFIAKPATYFGASILDVFSGIGTLVKDVFTGRPDLKEYEERFSVRSNVEKASGMFKSYEWGEDVYGTASEALGMASQSLPYMLTAIGTTALTRNPSAGMAVMALMEAGNMNSMFRKMPEFYGLSSAEKVAAISAGAAVAAGLERVGGDIFLANKVLGGTFVRAITENPMQYGARVAGQIGLNLTSEQLTEVGTSFAQNLITANVTGDYSWFLSPSRMAEEISQIAAPTLLVSGGVQAFAVAKGNRSYVRTIEESKMDLNRIFQNTKPNTPERTAAIDEFIKSFNNTRYILEDNKNFYDFVSATNQADFNRINAVQNELAILEGQLRTSPTNNDLAQAIRDKYDELAAIEGKYTEQYTFSLGTEGIDTAIAANNRLIERERSRKRRFEKSFGGATDPTNAVRIKESEAEIARLKEKSNFLKQRKAQVPSNVVRDVPQAPLDLLLSVPMDQSESMKGIGYRVVGYDESGAASLVYDPLGKVKIDNSLPLNERARDAKVQADVAFMRSKGASKSAVDSEVIKSISDSIINGEALTPYQANYYSKNKNAVDQYVADSKEQYASIRSRIDESELAADVSTSVRESLPSIVNEATASALVFAAEKLGIKVYFAKDQYSIVKTLIADGDNLSSSIDILKGGRNEIGAAYFKGAIYITEKSNSKDVIEEVIHAFFDVDTALKSGLIRKIHSEFSKNASYKSVMNWKKGVYTKAGFTGLALVEEQVAEVLARALSNPSLEVSKNIISTAYDYIVNAIKNAFGLSDSDVNGMNAERIVKMFSDSIVMNKGMSARDIAKILESEDSVVDNNEINSMDEPKFSFRGEKSFLYNKTVTYSEFRLDSHGNIVEQNNGKGIDLKKTFNDYAHFRNWYNFMTNNGRTEIIGGFSYVDDQGNVKELRPPAPEVNKQTGEVIGREKYNRPISYGAKMIAQNVQKQKSKDELRMNGIVVSNGISQYLSAKYGPRSVGEFSSLLPKADFYGYVETPGGKVLEGSKEHIDMMYETMYEFIEERDGMEAERPMFSIDSTPAQSEMEFRNKFNSLAEKLRTASSAQKDYLKTDMYALLRSIDVPDEVAKEYSEGNRRADIVDFIYAKNTLHFAKRVTPLLTFTGRAKTILAQRASNSLKAAFDQRIESGDLESLKFFEATDRGIRGFLSDSNPTDFGGDTGMEWAKNNVNLFKAIIAITSNGNTSNDNAALAKYVMMALARNISQDGTIDSKKKTIKGLINKISNSNAFTGIGVNPQRAMSIGIQLSKFLKNIEGKEVDGSYDKFLYEMAMKPGTETAWATSALMDMISPKIGAWLSNMLGNEDVVTQDSHLVQVINIFRGAKRNKEDWNGLVKILGKDYYDLLENSQKRMTVVGQIIRRSCYKKHERDDLGLSNDKIKALDKWFKKNKKDLLPTKPRNKKEREFIAGLVTDLSKSLSKDYGAKVSPALAQQMLFQLNHEQRHAAGVSRNSYQDYHDSISNMSTTEAARGAFDAVLNPMLVSEAVDRQIKSDEAFRVSEDGRAMFSITPGESRTHREDEFISPNGEVLNSENIDEVLAPYPLHTAIVAQGTVPKDGQRVFVYVDPRIMSETLHPVVNVSRTLSGQPMHVTSEAILTDVKFPRPSAFNMAGIAANESGPKKHVSGKFKQIQETDDLMTGVLVEMDPLRNNGFADENGRLIKSADEVTFIGGKMIARGNIQYYPESMNKNGLSAAETTASAATRTQAQNEAIIEAVRENLRKHMPEVYTEDEDALLEIFDSLTPENQQAILVNPASKKGRLRGTAERAAASEDFYEIKNDILDNPNNYLETQHLDTAKEELRGKSIQELVSMMRGDKLGSLMNRNDDLGVLAGIEIINRMQAEGRVDAIPGVIEDLAKMGTSVGRLLRQFAELKTSTSFGLYSTIAKLAESQGKVLNDKQKSDLQVAADAFMDSYREYQALLDRAIAGEDVEAELGEAIKKYSDAQSQLDTLTNVFVDKSWADIGIQLMQGNLLTSMSQAKNIAYNIAQMFPRTMVDLTSYPVEKLLGVMGMKTSGRRVSMAAYLHGLKKFGSGWVEAIEQVATGRSKEVNEWRMDRGFMPVRSLLAALSKDLPQTRNGRQQLNSRMKLLVAGTFGIPAETMFRFLSLGDIPFRRFAEATELYHVGVGKGLKGAELARFLKYPDRASMDKAADEGARMTFQKEGGLARGSMWIISNISRGLGKMFDNNKGFDAPGFFRFFIRSNVPYVTTIANFMEESLTYISPAFGTARVASNLLNNNAEEASKNATKVMIGQVFTQGALYMIASGVLSGAVDWEDDEKTNIMYDVMPPNSINITALKRLMNGGDPTPQEGDVYKSYQTFGVLGSIMGAYAQSMTREAAQDAIGNPTKGINILKRFLGMENASLISYMMDQSFMQGLNGMLEVITESDPEKLEMAMERYAESLSKAYSAMAIPNFFSGANMATREFLPDKRDQDLTDRIFNHVKERTFNTDGLPVKVNWKGERISQSPKGGNQFAYYMFDPYKTTTTGTDPVSIEILGIYTRTGELPKAVGTPYYASSVHRKLEVPSLKAKKAQVALDKLRDRGKSYSFIGKTGEEFRFSLTAEELNDMLEMSNSHRYADIQQFMKRPEYSNMSDGEKIDALNEINEKYNSMIEYYPDGTFMPHSIYVLDLIQERYQSLQP